jgi:Flp pilus assembly protein TadD
MLAQAVYEQDRVDDAAQLCEQAARSAPPEDLVTQVVWRGVQGKVLARREQFEDGESLAREAVALVEQTDLLTHHGDALLDLATVLRLAGRTADAESAFQAGCSLHERKGNTAATQQRMEVS